MSPARGFSAALFGGAAALIALGVIVALVLVGGASAAVWSYLVLPLMCALPVALVGAGAGPVMAQAERPARAVAVGAVAALVAVVVLVGLAFCILLVGELTGSRPNLAYFDWEDSVWIVVLTLAAGVVCSPVGGLCGYGVWRSLQQAPPSA